LPRSRKRQGFGAAEPLSGYEKAPVRQGAYIFFIDEHFTNLPFASRQRLDAGAIAEHLTNFP
jgi:hypothetical protein